MVYYYCIYGNNRLEVVIILVCLRLADTGKLSTRISVISLETAHRKNFAAQWSNEYQLDLIQSGYATNYDMKFCCCYGL